MSVIGRDLGAMGISREFFGKSGVITWIITLFECVPDYEVGSKEKASKKNSTLGIYIFFF